MFKYLTLVFFCFNAFASNITLNPEFKKLEEFISKITTVQGKLVQKSEGSSSEAEFYFKIPSKLRMNYLSKSIPINMIITPTVTTYYDIQLEQKTQLKTPKIITDLILTPKLSLLDKNIKIINFNVNNNDLSISFTHSSINDTQIKAIFNKNNLYIEKIILTSNNKTETIDFYDLKFNKKIENNKFSILNKKIDAKFDF